MGWVERDFPMKIFTLPITATGADIDELGHVNNAVWVRWIQDVATTHWRAVADPAHVEKWLWVVTRHEIDYLRPLLEGTTVIARTWIGEEARGARSVRHMEFVGEDGKTVHVRARTEWAMIDRVTLRALRIPLEVLAPFWK